MRERRGSSGPNCSAQTPCFAAACTISLSLWRFFEANCSTHPTVSYTHLTLPTIYSV